MSQGVIRRKDKEISREEIGYFLAQAAVAHFATTNANGDPYVVPNLFVYADGLIHLHTSLSGHFRRNVEARPRIAFEVAEMGTVFPYGEFACDTSVSYTSVVGFGAVRIDDDPTRKQRFFDRLMAKYADPKWARAQSFYPRLNLVTVYAIEVERLSGKRCPPWPIGGRRKTARSRRERWRPRSNSAHQRVGAAALERALIGGPRVDALQEGGEFRPAVERVPAHRCRLHRKAHHDVGAAKVVAREPRRFGERTFPVIHVQHELRIDKALLCALGNSADQPPQ